MLLRGHGRVVLVDTGSFSVRRTLLARLAERGIDRHAVADILLSHAHYDHMMNWTLFPNASVAIGEDELEHALADPIETSLSAELYVQALAASPRRRKFSAGEDALHGILILPAPGHTPHHLAFMIDDDDRRLILAADAVKNRAELLTGSVASTQNDEESRRTIIRLRSLWMDRPGAILICGHDLPIRNEAGGARVLGLRRVGISAWLGASLDEISHITLSGYER